VHGGEEIEMPLTPAFEAAVATDVVKDGSLRVAVMVDACEVGTVVVTSTAIVVVGAAPAPVTPPTVIDELAVAKAAFNVALFVVTTLYITTLLSRRLRAALCAKFVISDVATPNEVAAAAMNELSSTGDGNVCFPSIVYFMVMSAGFT